MKYISFAIPCYNSEAYMEKAINSILPGGEDVEIIKLNGSIELAPLTGLADVIFDIVQSGGTLRANGLAVLEEVFDISARLIANKAAYKFKEKEIREIVGRMREVTAK